MTKQHINVIEKAIEETKSKLSKMLGKQLDKTAEYKNMLSDLIALETCLMDMSSIIK